MVATARSRESDSEVEVEQCDGEVANARNTIKPIQVSVELDIARIGRRQAVVAS